MSRTLTTPFRRVLPWVGFAGDFLGQPLTEMPHEAIIAQLRQCFDTTCASYSWAEGDGRQGIVIHPADTLNPVAEEFLAWQRGEFVGTNPLLAWHLRTGDPRPSTNLRVPTGIVSARARRPILELQQTIGCEQQLAINFRLSHSTYHSYVLARTGTDFSDEDLLVAGQIQRLVIGLDRQIRLFRRLTPSQTDPGTDAGLTPRELSVLALLEAGLSTQLIASRLGCSPRTVNKHLERLYRKLGVRDRVNAIRIAHHWNLASPASPGSPR